METLINRGNYDEKARYRNKDLVFYNKLPYILNIPKEEYEYVRYVVGEFPNDSRYWIRFIPEIDKELELRLSSKEVKLITSCIGMAIKEGLYDFDNDRIEHTDKDMISILLKLGKSKTEAEAMLRYY